MLLLPFLVAPVLAAEPRHLTLEEALAALDAHNPSLRRAEAQVEAARGGKLAALSGVLPSVTATGNYTRNNEEVKLDLSELFDAIGAMAALAGQTPPDAPAATVLQPLDAWTGTASVRVPLIAPAAWAGIGGANHSFVAAQASESAARLSLRSSAEAAFWGEASAESLVEAQEGTVERARALAETAAHALQAGTGTRLGVLQAQTEAARREGDLLQSQATLEKARIAVGVLLGEPGPVMVDLPADRALVAREVTLEEAWAARGEVLAAEAQLAAARAQLLSVQIGAAPTVSAAFSAFASTEPFLTGDQTGWKGTVDLSWPLLQGGLRAGNEQKARAQIADAAAALDAAKLLVSQQVQSAAADLRVARARVDVTARQAALAEEAAAVAQRGFEAGALDSPAVLDSLDRLDLAHAAAIDARARQGIADAALRAAAGRW